MKKDHAGQKTRRDANLPKKVDTELNELLESFGATVKAKNLSTEAQETAKEIQEKIAPSGKFAPEQMWFPVAPMPTTMCRVSPFHPISQRQLKDRPFLRDMVITKSSWGQITYTGPKLSTYEEDALMAILAILDSTKRIEETTEEGRKTYIYRGPLLPILKLMGYNRPGKREYNRVMTALKLMTVAGVELKTKDKSWSMANILTAAKWNEKTKELTVVINPFFYETYVAGTVTLLDVLKRSRLSKPIAKALYRFITSHRDNKWSGHFLTLAASLNLDLEQPHFKLRQLIKQAIAELQKNTILTNTSGFSSRDVVLLIRNQNIKSGDKMLSD